MPPATSLPKHLDERHSSYPVLGIDVVLVSYTLVVSDARSRGWMHAVDFHHEALISHKDAAGFLKGGLALSVVCLGFCLLSRDWICFGEGDLLISAGCRFREMKRIDGWVVCFVRCRWSCG